MRTSKYISDFAKTWFAFGFAKGYAEVTARCFEEELAETFARAQQEGYELGLSIRMQDGIRLILHARRIEVPPWAAARIEAERDRATIERWLDRALTTKTVEAVFSED